MLHSLLTKTYRPHLYRMAAVAAACSLYGAAAATLIFTSTHHYELWVLALRLLLLLPTATYALYIAGSENYAFTFGKYRRSWMLILVFVICALFVSYKVSQSITFADESSYRFQARVFASLKMTAEAPPRSPMHSIDTPWPLAYKHLILSSAGWFSKYPVGWPLLLALPEKVKAGWAVTPVLGGALLALLALIARETFGMATAGIALWIAVLSPYCLSYTTGRMSHALCAVLIAAAALFCLRALRTNNLYQFALMFTMLLLAYHVRPFTAFIASGVFSALLFWNYVGNRSFLSSLAFLAAGFGLLTVFSVMLYNRGYTGHVWLSPYALYDGTSVPVDISATPRTVLNHLLSARRTSMQTTLLYSFPFVFALAAYGFWVERKSRATWILACLFPAIFIAHLPQATSSPIVGERFYFESYFSVVILGARGLQLLILKWRSRRYIVLTLAVVLTLMQITLAIAGVTQIESVGQPYREVNRLAKSLRNCHCAVFLDSSPDHDVYYSPNLNLNTPDWHSSPVFYFNDPGPDERSSWADAYGWRDWAVITYDTETRTAGVEFHRAARNTNPR